MVAKVTNKEKKTISDLISTDFFDVTEDDSKLTEDDTRRDGGNLKYFRNNPKHARQLLRKKKPIKSKSKRKCKK
jgi:hypothetical protein